MKTAELKTDILKLFVEIEDISVLEKVKNYLSSLNKPSKETRLENELSEKQKQDILLSEEDIKNGDLVSHNEVQKMAKKVLSIKF